MNPRTDCLTLRISKRRTQIAGGKHLATQDAHLLNFIDLISLISFSMSLLKYL
jgi:hypothetical protein